MRVALVGAELEENLGLEYMAAVLEQAGHDAWIVPFNTDQDVMPAVQQIISCDPEITGLSMVFTSRAGEFCRLAQELRASGYANHLIAGGHFASLNCQQLLADYPAFDSVGLGEGEELICALADDLAGIATLPGICYRAADGTITINPSRGNPDNLDALPFPRRSEFYRYYDKPITSILSSRGCWRDCAFCSINAWYKQGGGKKFRVRSVENIVAEMAELYHEHGVRIFNFQDDNFFLADPTAATRRFTALRDRLADAGVTGIAIAVKARPDSITEDSVRILDELGLFRVFLGVENASENGLRHLNRKCEYGQILNALQILNEYGIHIAFNLLMFEPDTVLDDILTNLRFLERHVENPCNFCRAEAYAGTGLETKLRSEGRLLGDYFGFDYRLKDPASEAFHQIANYAFFDRNFSDFGLHYFNMQVDFSYQLLRRFYPLTLSEGLRAAVRNFIKRTNLDTYAHLCAIYDEVSRMDHRDAMAVRALAYDMRRSIDESGRHLYRQGECILNWLTAAHECKDAGQAFRVPLSGDGEQAMPRSTGTSAVATPPSPVLNLSFLSVSPVPYTGSESLASLAFGGGINSDAANLWNLDTAPIPYHFFQKRLAAQDVRQEVL